MTRPAPGVKTLEKRMDALKDRYETVDPVRISICTRVRFLPECYLASCRLDRDPQAEYLLYIRSLINEDE